MLLLSNASYQALRMLKDMFTQMNYIIKIETGRSAKVSLFENAKNNEAVYLQGESAVNNKNYTLSPFGDSELWKS